MKNITKVYCLFEQSGTFKNEFKKLGIPASDYDLENRYGETDIQCNLFSVIEKTYAGNKETFLNFLEEDCLVFAFFPCTFFSCQSMLNLLSTGKQYKDYSDMQKVERALEIESKRSYYYSVLCKLVLLSYRLHFNLIIENPFSQPHYLTRYFPVKPAVIHRNRRLYGDLFEKPTQYWFFNFQPAFNLELATAEPQEHLFVEKNNKGLERSLITSKYAELFIKNYIIEE